MNLLALDTATDACSAAVWLDGRLHGRCELAGRSHTQRLPQLVQQVMAEAGLPFGALDGLVCGVGPGSFAGVRIGVAYTQGLALGLDRPVLGVTSLAMLAMASLAESPDDARVLVAIDARMAEVYFQPFARDAQGLPQPLAEARVCAPTAVPAQIGDWLATGTGWGAYPEALRAATQAQLSTVQPDALPDAAAALRIAAPRFAAEACDAARLMPVYLRNQVALTLVEQQARRAETVAQRAVNAE